MINSLPLFHYRAQVDCGMEGKDHDHRRLGVHTNQQIQSTQWIGRWILQTTVFPVKWSGHFEVGFPTAQSVENFPKRDVAVRHLLSLPVHHSEGVLVPDAPFNNSRKEYARSIMRKGKIKGWESEKQKNKFKENWKLIACTSNSAVLESSPTNGQVSHYCTRPLRTGITGSTC